MINSSCRVCGDGLPAQRWRWGPRTQRLSAPCCSKPRAASWPVHVRPGLVSGNLPHKPWLLLLSEGNYQEFRAYCRGREARRKELRGSEEDRTPGVTRYSATFPPALLSRVSHHLCPVTAFVAQLCILLMDGPLLCPLGMTVCSRPVASERLTYIPGTRDKPMMPASSVHPHRPQLRGASELKKVSQFCDHVVHI